VFLGFKEFQKFGVFLFNSVRSEVATGISSDQLSVLELLLENRALMIESKTRNFAIKAKSPTLPQTHSSYSFEVSLSFWLDLTLAT
jgi:hypothetical protein